MRKEQTQGLLNADPGRLADLGSTVQRKLEISDALFCWWGKSTSQLCAVVMLLLCHKRCRSLFGVVSSKPKGMLTKY